MNYASFQGDNMTLADVVQEVHEKTHVPQIEILEIIRKNWPKLTEFKPTQVRLVVNLIERKARAA